MTSQMLGRGNRRNKISGNKIHIDLSKQGSGKLGQEHGGASNAQEQNSSGTDSDIIYVPSDNHMTYFDGIKYLKLNFEKDGKAQPTIIHEGNVIPAALTLEEILKARIQQYNSLSQAEKDAINSQNKDKIPSLFKLYFWTGDGIAYKKKTDSEPEPPFKLVKQSSKLAFVKKNELYVPIDYSTITETELQRTGCKYKTSLTADEVLVHETWAGLVSKDVLEKYVEICFKLLKDVYNRETGMSFWLWSPEKVDTLRSVYVYKISLSNASGNSDLNSSAFFLQVTRAPKFSTGNGGGK